MKKENIDKNPSSSVPNINNLDEKANNIGIGGKYSPEKNEQLYKERMQERKNIQKERLKIRTSKKGLIVVFTGKGKGKTTAALGMALRTIGHGYKVAIIQFIKGGWKTGEEKALKTFSKDIAWHSLGEGFTWETQNRIRDEELVKNAWEISRKYINDESYKLVILDEINIAIKLGYLNAKEIVEFFDDLGNRDNHIVLTGRSAPELIQSKADLVTNMDLVKHPFKDQGIKAQKCIEF